MKFLFVLFFVFGSFFSWSQYNSPGQGSYTREQMNRLENSINVQATNVSLEDLSGTWTYSGSGCRNPSLSSASHQTEASEIGSLTHTMLIVFSSAGQVRVEMEYFDEAELLRKRREEGENFDKSTVSRDIFVEEVNYSLNGNRIDFQVPNPDESFLAYFRHNYLLPGSAGMNLVLTDVNLDGIQSCGLDHISVLIFNKVD